MNTFQFWQRWLTLLSWVVVLFGVGMALLNRTPIFLLFDAQVNPAFWGSAALPVGVEQFQGWIYGIFGATMAGWGIFLVYIARYPFERRERWAWNWLLQGLLVWYLLATGISLFFGVFFNAIFNTVILVLLLLPVIFTRKEFK